MVKYALYMYINDDETLKELYLNKAVEHNLMVNNNSFADSGFDLFTPQEQQLNVNEINKINFKVKCQMVKYTDNSDACPEIPSAFYMYPRSSISKTKFRLANNVGIIDSGYRGNLMGMFDVIYSQTPVKCDKHNRLLQICTPTLEPFKVIIVDNDNAFSETQRGEGGFGSTGM